MKVFLALLCALSCLDFPCCVVPCHAAPPAVVVVLLPPATLQGWQNADTPTLHRLMQTGALGVMNTRIAHQAGREEQETAQSALLTLAAGARAAGSPRARFLPASAPAPGTGGTAAALFERRTAVRAEPGRLVCLDWPAICAANQNPGYDLRLGSFTETLNARGVSVAAGGGLNADWLAAGGDGTVQRISLLRAAPGRCLVWDAGPDLPSADTVLADAAAQVAAAQGRLVVLSPYAGDAAARQLAPVLVWGPGIPAGLLGSPSTRRPGLVTNTDFAPSVAALFGISRPQFRSLPFGFAWSPIAAPGAVGICERLDTESVRQLQGMRLLPYAAASLGFWIVCISCFAARFAVPPPALFVPLAALSAALLAGTAAEFGLIFPADLAVLVFASRFIGVSSVPTLASVFLVLIVCADTVTGNKLMHHGLLGYSALEGARYYGVGNEAMGLLLGAALIASARLWQPSHPSQFVLIGVMAGIVVLLGTAGAKAGGVLVALAVFGTFLIAAGRRRWTAKAVFVIAGAAFAGLAVAALSEVFFHTGSHSHIGEAVQRIAAGGPGEAWDIVRRKLAVEGRLAYSSAWAVLLWLGLLSTGWLWRKPAAGEREEALRLAGGVGFVACVLLNDAGVVAGAIFIALLWSAAATQEKSPPVLDASKTEGPIT